MAAPTELVVTVDKTEYSKYESSNSVITASITAMGTSFAGEVVLVELVKARRNRDAVIMSANIVLTNTAGLETQSVVFDLSNAVDPDGLSLVRRGKYFVKATYNPPPLTGTVEGDSPDFYISIITVDKLKREYLFGLPLTATLSKQAQNQPSLAGVTITNVSEDHSLGFFDLQYNYVAPVGGPVVRELSWAGGTTVSITGPGKYFLPQGVSGSNNPIAKLLNASQGVPNYIEVTVASVTLLPTTHSRSSILINKTSLDDTLIRDFITQSCDWLEQVALDTYVEPTNVVTEQDPTTIQFGAGVGSPSPLFTDTDFDFIVTPCTYFRPGSGGWLSVQTQFTQVLRVDSLFGAISNTRVIDIDLDWIELSGPGGLIQVVPFNQTVAFDYIGLLWVDALRGAMELPNFWHFNMIVGLRECPPNLQEMIAKKAVIDILGLLGAAFRPGVGSTSLGRDGVSQSVSYLTQAKYGIYSGQITLFKEWIDTELKMAKGRYTGPRLRVV